MTASSNDAPPQHASPEGVRWNAVASRTPAAVDEREPGPGGATGSAASSYWRGVCLVDRSGKIVAADDAVSSWLGEPGAADLQLEQLMDAPDVAAHLERAFQGEQDLNLAVRLAGRASTEPPLVMRVRVVTGSAGQWAIVEFHREAAPRPSVRLDPLTGLADRAAIAQHIGSWRLDAAPRGTPFAVLFLDLDRFKRVNDEHGHAVGDAVLQAVAARWLKCVREDDLVARYGGDEFVILLKGVSATEEVDPVVRRLTMATLEPVTFGGQRLQVAVTIGVAFATSGEPAVEVLVAAADRDMYSRKRASRP